MDHRQFYKVENKARDKALDVIVAIGLGVALAVLALQWFDVLVK